MRAHKLQQRGQVFETFEQARGLRQSRTLCDIFYIPCSFIRLFYACGDQRDFTSRKYMTQKYPYRKINAFFFQRI